MIGIALPRLRAFRLIPSVSMVSSLRLASERAVMSTSTHVAAAVGAVGQVQAEEREPPAPSPTARSQVGAFGGRLKRDEFLKGRVRILMSIQKHH
jgi:hypothetical protein